MSEIDNGTITITIGETKTLYTNFYHDSDEYREVIVALKNAVSIPFPALDLGGVGATDNPPTPQEAEGDAKEFLGVSNNYYLDRWWVKSDVDGFEKDSQGYPTPQNDGYAFDHAVKVIDNNDDSILGLIAFFTKTISSTKRACIALTAVGATPYSPLPSVGSRFETYSMSNPSGTDFDLAAQSIFGQGNYSRGSLNETITKLAPYQSFPQNW
jgi:hypothetical protein